MKKSNKVNIDTGLFSISFNWNVHVVALHVSVFISLLALTVITREAAIHKLCVTFLAIEVIVLLILFFCRFSITIGEKEEKRSTESKDKSEPTEKSDLDITVDHSKKDKKDTTKTSKKKEEVINNKVPIPNAPSVQSPQAEPEPEAVQEQQANGKEKVIDDMTAKFTEGAMSEEDWEELFKM